MKEFHVLEKKNQTWKIRELLENKKSIGCKWIYKIKYRSKVLNSGTIVFYKIKSYVMIQYYAISSYVRDSDNSGCNST
jgi:hypothetical protein